MADGQGEAAWGTSGQVSLHGKAHPLNTYKRASKQNTWIIQ